MKILHITDVHGNVEALDGGLKLGARGKYDVIAVTGDLAKSVLLPAEGKRLNAAYREINAAVSAQNEIPFGKKLEGILSNPEMPAKLREAAQFYLDLEARHDAGIDTQYRAMADLFRKYPEGRILVIPGNWDRFKDFEQFGAFENWCIHGKQEDIGGIKFAGCGGATSRHVTIPPTRFTWLDEDAAFNFLQKTDADVVLSHVPPRGMLDLSGSNGDQENIGSWALRAYLVESKPSLFLCGHAHESTGVGRPSEGYSLVTNPGPLAAEFNPLGHGTAYGITLGENNYAKSVAQYKIENGKASQLNEITVLDE